MRTALWCLLACTALAVSANGAFWEAGAFTKVSVGIDFQYNVSVNGSEWLSNGAFSFHCQGSFYAYPNGGLAAVGIPTVGQGADAALGEFRSITQPLQPPNVPDCFVNASIRYYNAADLIEFVAEFHSKGTPGTAAAPRVLYNKTTHKSSWGTGTLALATQFPSFDWPKQKLGFVNTHGVSLNNNFAWSRDSLEKWSGLFRDGVTGLNSGPLMLYRSEPTDDQQHPPAAILAPLTHSKSVYPSAVTKRTKTNDSTSLHGIFVELTHHQMNPIVCQQSASILTCINRDPRASTCWVTANCTLLAGDTNCIEGNFWSDDGTKFATQNWTATIQLNNETEGLATRIETSEGSIWINAGIHQLAVGVQGWVTELPAAFVQRVALVGRDGINSAYKVSRFLVNKRTRSIRRSYDC
jgi:hypothetical protein